MKTEDAIGPDVEWKELVSLEVVEPSVDGFLVYSLLLLLLLLLSWALKSATPPGIGAGGAERQVLVLSPMSILAASRNTPEHSESDMEMSSGPCLEDPEPRMLNRFFMEDSFRSDLPGDDDDPPVRDCEEEVLVSREDRRERERENMSLSSLRTEMSSLKSLLGIV